MLSLSALSLLLLLLRLIIFGVGVFQCNKGCNWLDLTNSIAQKGGHKDGTGARELRVEESSPFGLEIVG